MGILDTLKSKTTSKKAPAKTSAKSESPKVEKATTKKAASKDTGNAYKVLMNPLVTEKSTFLSHGSKYSFKVAPETNKIEVAKAVKALYNVDVENVNIVNVRGKLVQFSAKPGKRKDYKKAIVTLKKGQKISVFEGV